VRLSARWAAGIACAVAIALGWMSVQRPSGHDAPPSGSSRPARSPATADTRTATPAHADPTAAPAAPAAPPAISTERDIVDRQIPLPGTLREVLAELTPRAERGDADAAYRIFIKLNDCIGALDGSPFVTLHVGEMAKAAERAWMTDTLAKLADCEGITADQIDSRVHWLTRAADLGDPLAQLTYTISSNLIVGDATRMMADPRAVEHFKTKSLRFLTTLAARGDVSATLSLSNAYHVGVLVPRDDVKAYAYGYLGTLLGSNNQSIVESLATPLTPAQRLQGEQLAITMHRRCCG
jgi:hypothetical protein